jgi:hypothetical protein
MTIGQNTGNVNSDGDTAGDVTLGGTNAMPPATSPSPWHPPRRHYPSLPAIVPNLSMGSGSASGTLELAGSSLQRRDQPELIQPSSATTSTTTAPPPLPT